MWHETCRRAEKAGRRVNGGMKKSVGRYPTGEERLRKGYRKEIGQPMTGTGHRDWL